MQLKNENLQRKITELERQLESPYKKRRKINLSIKNVNANESDVEESRNLSLSSVSSSSSNISEERANDLNQAIDVTGVDWSESFFSSQNNNNETPQKSINYGKNTQNTSNSTPRKVLSPINKNLSVQQKEDSYSSSNPSVSHNILPRRLKLSISSSKKEKCNENQNPIENTSKWIATKESKNESRNLGMSFLQPQKSSSILSEIVTSKDNKIKINPENKLSLKSHSKLRQTKLLFDIVKDDDDNHIKEKTVNVCIIKYSIDY